MFVFAQEKRTEHSCNFSINGNWQSLVLCQSLRLELFRISFSCSYVSIWKIFSGRNSIRRQEVFEVKKSVI